MNTASDVFRTLVAVILAASLANVASAGTTTAATTTTTSASSAALKNLKKLLSAVDPNQLADGVSRFIYCASHHHKALQNAVTPAVSEWNACANKHPDWEAQVTCFLKGANNVATFVALGHQIGSMAGCLLGSNATEVLCVKKVQKSEECNAMCVDAHSATSNETVVVNVPAVQPTVRKDDCKLLSKSGSTPANSNLTASLDFTMKVLQCLPAHFGDSYQHLTEHIKSINNCTQQYEDNWYNWAKCVVEVHDIKLVSPYLVKGRLAVACIMGGDVPSQTVCVRTVRSAEECRTCGGQDLHPVEAVPPLAATNNCV